MTRDEIEALVSRRADVMNRHDAAALGRLYTEDCVLESPSAGGTIAGARAIDDINRAWIASFPDLTFTTDGLAIDGDRLAWMAIAEGTGTGAFMGAPSAGRRFSVPMIFLSTLADGRITRERRIYDFTGMLIQLGALKLRGSRADVPDVRGVPVSHEAGAPTDRGAFDELLRERERYFRAHDADAIAAQHAVDGVMDSHVAGRVEGRAAVADVYRRWFAAFPDAELAREELIVDGATAVETATMTGTDTGGWLGLPPTGRPFRLTSVWLYVARGAELVYARPTYDFTGMLVQLGLLKAKPV